MFLQKLSSPTIENNCEYVIPMLSRLDEIISYLEQNESHKENATYTQLSRHVLRKALQIIKNYTVSSLNAASHAIVQSLQAESGGSGGAVIKFTADNSYTMFYSKFRVNSSRIKTLMEQLEQRVELTGQPDYDQALGDCHQCYIQQRRAFIYASVVSAVNDFVLKHTRDTCTLVCSTHPFTIITVSL